MKKVLVSLIVVGLMVSMFFGCDDTGDDTTTPPDNTEIINPVEPPVEPVDTGDDTTTPPDNTEIINPVEPPVEPVDPFLNKDEYIYVATVISDRPNFFTIQFMKSGNILEYVTKKGEK